VPKWWIILKKPIETQNIISAKVNLFKFDWMGEVNLLRILADFLGCEFYMVFKSLRLDLCTKCKTCNRKKMSFAGALPAISGTSKRT
jgi:hypothetical protein